MHPDPRRWLSLPRMGRLGRRRSPLRHARRSACSRCLRSMPLPRVSAASSAWRRTVPLARPAHGTAHRESRHSRREPGAPAPHASAVSLGHRETTTPMEATADRREGHPMKPGRFLHGFPQRRPQLCGKCGKCRTTFGGQRSTVKLRRLRDQLQFGPFRRGVADGKSMSNSLLNLNFP